MSQGRFDEEQSWWDEEEAVQGMVEGELVTQSAQVRGIFVSNSSVQAKLVHE
jgi:hypothetical protein